MKTFADIPTDYHLFASASIILQPVPYDETSTWIKGADRGLDFFLESARNMELFHIETSSEVYKKGIHLAEPMTYKGPPEEMVERVYRLSKDALKEKKFFTILGGEHSVSIGTIRAHAEEFSDLTVIQLDAHADLRQSYHGSTCNHACALHESSKRDNLLQIGIRSMDISEKTFMKESKVWFASEIWNSTEWIEDVIDRCTENIYVTIDLDVFDPGLMPSTGTPEPGGLGWWQVMTLLDTLTQRKHVRGFDIVELAPIPGLAGPNFLAAKLYYNFLSYCFRE